MTSVFTALSAEVGTEPPAHPLQFPTLAYAKDLKRMATEDINVMQEVLRLNRFLPEGDCQEEWEIQEVLIQALHKGQLFWSHKFAE